jgi:hypothetical protein
MPTNDGNDIPIVPGMPHRPMSMLTAQPMVTTQQAAPTTWMAAPEREARFAGAAGAGVRLPN